MNADLHDDASPRAVLHVAYQPMTGVWAVMRELAAAQLASGRYTGVGLGVVHDGRWPDGYRAELADSPCTTYRAAGVRLFGTAAFLLQLLRRRTIARWAAELATRSGASAVTVHMHNAWLAGVYVPLPRVRVRLVPLTTFHGVNIYLVRQPVRLAIHRWMAARLVRHRTGMTSVARYSLGLAESVLKVPQDRFAVIPNGSHRRAGRAGYAAGSDGELVVGQIGTVNDDKGWQLAAEAVCRLRAAGCRIRFVIAGTGSAEAEAARLADAHPDAVRYAGFVPDAADRLLPEFDVVTLPSVQEGLPMAVIEAMSAGVPVVASAVGGIPEAVEHGRTGLLVERDGRAVEAALRRLYESPDLLAELSRHTRAVFDARFEIGRVVAAYDAYYRRLGAIGTVPSGGGG